MLNVKFKAVPLVATSILALSLLGGCSSTQNAGDQFYDNMAKEREFQQEVKKEILDNIPDWFLESPSSDENGFYSVSSFESENLAMAMNGAKLRAQKELAASISKLISAEEKMFTKSYGSKSVTNMEEVINGFINQADIAGVVYDKSDLQQIGNNFIYYVRAYLPTKQLKRLKDEREAFKSLDVDSADAQRRLMLRIEKAKKAANLEKETQAKLVQAKADKKAADLIEEAKM